MSNFHWRRYADKHKPFLDDATFVVCIVALIFVFMAAAYIYGGTELPVTPMK